MTNRDILDELRVRGELVERLKRIAPRFREIINLRYGLSFETGLIVRGEMTMEQVAKLYSITNERLRQIEERVFKKLSEGLTDSPWHTGTPSEEGWYLVKLDVEHHDYPFYVFKWYKGGWYSAFDMTYPACPQHSVLKWQKIEE